MLEQNPILQNLIILFILLPAMLYTWEWFVRRINTKLGFKLKEIYETIYSDPVASAILRGVTMATIAYMVVNAYGRLV